MENIKIHTGVIRLQVECDGRMEEISFNPNDVIFMENFYKLMGEMEQKQAEHKEKVSRLEQETDAESISEKLAWMREICMFLREQVDAVFGAGTSQKIFGGANTLDMFTQFFEGITPFIQKNRAEKLGRYTAKNHPGVM